MSSPLYRGYSSVANQGVDTQLQDMQLVNQDLLNQFNTRLDERIGRPRWGSIIWDLLFDLSNDQTEALIIADCQRIINSDPRVELVTITPVIDLEAGSIQLSLLLYYVEINMDGPLLVNFNIDATA